MPYKTLIATVAALFVVLWINAGLAAAPAAVNVRGAYVRVPIPGQHNTVAFLRITNTGKTALTLTGVSAAIATRAQLHVSKMHKGVMTMRREKQLVIAPGETLSFAPGKRHIMLLALRRTIQSGSAVKMTLHFAKAGAVRVKAKVKSFYDHKHG